MAVNGLPAHFAPAFRMNLELGLQQKQSKLESLVSTGMYQGDGARVVDRVEATEMREVVGKYPPIEPTEAEHSSRWVSPTPFDHAQIVDTFEKLKLLENPESIYVQNALAAARRKKDQIILNSFFAPAQTGGKGTDLVVFPESQKITTAGAFTVAKMIAAKQKLRQNEVDLEAEEVYAILSADDEATLLAESQVVSADFNNQRVLVDGKVTRFMGINFIYTEKVLRDETNRRRIPVFVKSGMHLGIWKDITTDIDKRKDLKGLPWQAYIMMMMGATRLDEKKVVEVKVG